MKQYNNATIERAHDVRTLRVCEHCGGIGNNPSMLLIQVGTDYQNWHGRCYIKAYGLSSFLKLPRAQTDKIPMSDMGVSVMKALMKSREISE